MRQPTAYHSDGSFAIRMWIYAILGLDMEARKQIISVSEITRGIAQRVRNPLNAFQLNLESLEDEITSANIENSLERLRRMRNTVAEIDYFLSEILRVTDLPRPQITPVNINQLVAEVETFARPESLKKEVTVSLNLQVNLPELQADPVQIKQVILKVLLNAIEASPLKGSITLATEEKNGHVIIKVTDQGEGILPAARERIFEPFFSTKEGGAGLGLLWALKIVKLHRGGISFTSETGKGSTFVISLPSKRNIGKK